MYLGFSSDELGFGDLGLSTRVVQPVLSTVDGVASADILGGQILRCGCGSIRCGWRGAAYRRTTSRRRLPPTTSRPRPAGQRLLHRLEHSTNTDLATSISSRK
jgi:hypothetical protein